MTNATKPPKDLSVINFIFAHDKINDRIWLSFGLLCKG